MRRIKDQKLIENHIKSWSIDKILKNADLDDFEIHEFEKGEYIFKSDEKIRYFYFLVSGKAKVYIIMENGKAFLVGFYMPFEIMGDVEVMGDGYSHCNVQSLQKTILIAVPIEKMKHYMDKDVELLKFIGGQLSLKLRRRTDMNAMDRFYPLENRFVSYLNGLLNFDEDELEVELEKLKDVSELLGTSYRHLARVIKSLCDEKIIEKNKNKIKIMDVEGVKKLSTHIYEYGGRYENR